MGLKFPATEAANYKDQDVFVVGGANSAFQGALYLSRYARKVTVLIRSSEATASKYLIDALHENKRIEILMGTELLEVHGTGGVEEIVVRNNQGGAPSTLKGSAIFVFIGVRPASDWIADLIQRDEKGYILTGADLVKDGKRPAGWTLERDPYLLETSVPGIFAAGDVRFGTNHRVASAVGEGSIAHALIRQYLHSL